MGGGRWEAVEVGGGKQGERGRRCGAGGGWEVGGTEPDRHRRKPQAMLTVPNRRTEPNRNTHEYFLIL